MSDDSTRPPDDEKPEGWEAFSEEPSAGTLTPSEELEAALREASDAVETRAGAVAGAAGSVDKITIEALSAELLSLKGEYETQKDTHLRLQAEFENFRRRSLKERQEAHSFGHQNLVKDLLPVVDNLDRAIEHARQTFGDEHQPLVEGVEMVRREFMTALANHGVNEIEADGTAFDPNVHEAMAQMPNGEVPPNTVVQVLQKGYVLRDRMLRPARVIVSREPTEEDGQAAGEGESS